MNKILLIINREYRSRVKKKSFLLTTFLVPLFFIGMYVALFFMMKTSLEGSHAIVDVLDGEGSIAAKLESDADITFRISGTDLQEQIERLKNGKDEANLLVIPADFYGSRKIEILSSGKPNMHVQREVESRLRDIVRQAEYARLDLNADSIRNINDSVHISAKEVTETGDARESHTEVAIGIALALSVLIYLTLFLYGVQVMRGVVEEKTSRIVEVVISSVRPFQLMLGKIIGIGLVGITQFVMWILLSLALVTVATTFMATGSVDLAGQMAAAGSMREDLPDVSKFDLVNAALASVNFGELILCFFIFFTGGYFLYSALFAAVGSAVDSETEASQFSMPITMPLLLAYILSFGVLVNDPHGTVSMWLSFIPFTSPIAMLVRVPFGVPAWQIIVSALLLVGGFVLTTWVAGRIYRVGILMYGKKAGFKELISFVLR